MRIIQTILRESKKVEKKKEISSEEPAKTVNIRIGDREWNNFPESEVRRITSLVRQIVRGTVHSVSIIEELVDQVPEEKKAKLRKVLEEIQKEHGEKIVTLIPESFPFLAAEGADEYGLADLDADSIDFLNIEQGTTGRGEVAVALLFGVEEFLNPAEKGEKRSSVSSYDLVYRGKQCDVKDARTMLKDGTIKLENYVRLGGVVSREIELEINLVLKDAGIYLLARDFFSNQTSCADPLAYVVMNNHTVESPNVLFAACKSLLEDILENSNHFIEKHLKKEYPGGIFIITNEKIRLYKPEEFEMYALKGDGRCTVEYTDTGKESYFLKGALKYLERNKVALFEEYKGSIKASSRVPQEDPDEDEQEESI